MKEKRDRKYEYFSAFAILTDYCCEPALKKKICKAKCPLRLLPILRRVKKLDYKTRTPDFA